LQEKRFVDSRVLQTYSETEDFHKSKNMSALDVFESSDDVQVSELKQIRNEKVVGSSQTTFHERLGVPV
jgi:hypothetical protein